MKLILLGAPGAGKGTQAEILAKKLNIPVISTGNILRAAVKNGTPTGLLAKEKMDKGELVSDDIIIGIVKERLAEPDCSAGYILDGVPRTLAQAQAIDEAGIVIDAVLLIDVADEVIEKRMTGRRTCLKCGATYHIEANPPHAEGVCDTCGGELTIRKDDKPETVRNRLSIYHAETEPLVNYYEGQGKLRKAEGNAPLAEVIANVEKALGIN